MRNITLTAMFAALALPAAAGEIRSEYTDVDLEKGCSTFDVATDGGDFANLACNGWRGYPVLIYQGDLRESIVYGFPSAGDHNWETFGPFNSTGPKIEWRIEKDGYKEIPFATIHRWHVSNPEDSEKGVEVLVVEKVGQIGEQQSCAVGLVMATGNPQANETARKIADEQVRTFVCGADERVIVGDGMPDFYRAD
jgi:hypothetical protein